MVVMVYNIEQNKTFYTSTMLKYYGSLQHNSILLLAFNGWKTNFWMPPFLPQCLFATLYSFNNLSLAQVIKPMQKYLVNPKTQTKFINLPKQTSWISRSQQMHFQYQTNFRISNIKETRDGDIVIGCAQSIGKHNEMAEKNLSDKYDVHIMKSAQPYICIVGMR